MGSLSARRLFPDLLEQADPFGHEADHLRRGCGIWGFDGGSTTRRRSENCLEGRHLFVIYDDQRFRVEPTGKYWTVEVRHYFNTHTMRGNKSEMTQRVHYFERHFETREEAIALAEKLLGVFARVNRRDEREAS